MDQQAESNRCHCGIEFNYEPRECEFCHFRGCAICVLGRKIGNYKRNYCRECYDKRRLVRRGRKPKIKPAT